MSLGVVDCLPSLAAGPHRRIDLFFGRVDPHEDVSGRYFAPHTGALPGVGEADQRADRGYRVSDFFGCLGVFTATGVLEPGAMSRGWSNFFGRAGLFFFGIRSFLGTSG